MAALRFRKYVAATATFAVALGIGFAMQNGDALASRFGSEAPLADLPTALPVGGFRITAIAPGILPSGGIVARHEAAPALGTPVVARAEDLTLPGSRADAARAALPVLRAAAPIDSGRTVAAVEVGRGGGCVPELAASAGPGAMVDLVLSAPCAPRAVAVIHHGGMMLSLLTDAAGEARTSVPALAAEAVYVAQIGRLPGATASVEVPEMAHVERAVLQWQGEAGLGLQALEHGYSGHAWAAPDRTTIQAALAGAGGFVSALGDRGIAGGYRAEVYSRAVGSPPVALEVEAAVLRDTCGREIAAQTIQVAPGVQTVARDLSLRMPDCAAVGEYLVLSNLLRDLTLRPR